MQNKYYVYLHRLIKNNQVIYVGSGSGNRMKTKSGRSKNWHSVVDNNSWSYSLIKENMSKVEAEDLELLLIGNYNPIGNVQRKLMCPKSLNKYKSFLVNRYEYDVSSPSYLRYKEDNKAVGINKKFKGDIAGYLQKGYYFVGNGEGHLLAHRVIWFLLNKEDPVNFYIDHIDGNRQNNNINNLRKISQKENSQNSAKKSNNVTGYSGITFIENKGYLATWMFKNKTNKKLFSIKKYGETLSKALAIEYRYRKIKELNLSGESYTDRHIGIDQSASILNLYTKEEVNKMLYSEVRSNNNSGHKGISFKFKNGVETHCIAQRIINGKNYSKSITLNKVSKESAISKLIEWLCSLS